MNLGLKGKVAVVLAASKGLGKASALALAAEGAKVIIGSRNTTKLNAAAKEISTQTGSEVHCIPVDVVDAKQLTDFISKAGNIYGSIDILVNNAGGPPFGKFENFDDASWQQAFEQNMLSFARTSRLVLPFMKPTGGGRIINIISGSVKSVLANSVLSTAMRMAVVGTAKMLADELGIYGITVNNIAPGLILTDRIKHTLPQGIDPEEAIKEKTKSIPLGRIGKPEEFAALVAFLSSAQAAYISGTTIQIDGGASRAIL
ncbi:3-oxoacyl-[acyl-carrier protein] reductase [Mucilaginibacter oryzae]|uniref:3-oxoacyl-[acyl-carrier protein] reductase n=1 Tax=Mucilaginibacter oryzae TaxID=468058 RepID=A0A316H9C5_9SPHI|nr:SDR family oxidoreductase [Mucilaginibacter oryzae]PWK77116.1 3-oxoacyl-[acyl-carrier protein] reductase [Mucilaginibacter oryzae]